MWYNQTSFGPPNNKEYRKRLQERSLDGITRSGVEQKNDILHTCRRVRMVSDTDTYAPETSKMILGVVVSIAIR